MEILVLIDKFYPESNANTVCLNNLINQFPQNVYHVVCQGNNNSVCRYSDNVFVYYVPSSRKKSNIVTKTINFMKLLLLYNVSLTDSKRYLDEGKRIISNNNISLIISICRPFTMAYASYRVQRSFPLIKCYSIFFDPPCANMYSFKLFNYIWRIRTISFMKRITKYNHKIILMENDLPICSFLMKELRYFIAIHGLPCYVPRKRITNEHVPCDLVYSGVLDINYRNPSKPLTFLLSLISRNKLNLRVNFYCKGCENLLNDFEKQYPSKFEYHSFVPQSDINRVIDSSACLINISNCDLKQVPSKIFNYFSSGKPILNFYFNDFDPSLPYFLKYKNCKNIKVDFLENKKTEAEVLDFLSNIRTIDYDELMNMFNENKPSSYSDIFGSAE